MRSRAIEQMKQSLVLTDEQREILFGVLLGDACLETQNRGRTYRVKFEQSDFHSEYIRHLYSIFQPWVLTAPRQRFVGDSAGNQHQSWSFQTVSHSAFRFFAHQFYADGVKRVPELIHRWLTPRGLAYWFMDDGSIKSVQSKGSIFNTQGFGRSDVGRLTNLLKSGFGLAATVRRHKHQFQIYVSGASSEQFQLLVGPYVIESMRYKLPRLK
jgi:hypothetical protein